MRQKTIAVQGGKTLQAAADELVSRGYQIIQLSERSDEVIDAVLTDSTLDDATVNEFAQLGVKIIWATNNNTKSAEGVVVVTGKDIVEEANRVRNGRTE